MAKLKEAQFGVGGAEGLQRVINAFCGAFSSLYGFMDDSGENRPAQLLLDWYAGGGRAREGRKIKALIDAHSYEDEWPGTAEIEFRQQAGSRPEGHEMRLTPYVGDRILRMIIWSDGTIIAVADYTKRPFGIAASAVIELLERVRYDWGGPVIRYNPPTFVEVE